MYSSLLGRRIFNRQLISRIPVSTTLIRSTSSIAKTQNATFNRLIVEMGDLNSLSAPQQKTLWSSFGSILNRAYEQLIDEGRSTDLVSFIVNGLPFMTEMAERHVSLSDPELKAFALGYREIFETICGPVDEGSSEFLSDFLSEDEFCTAAYAIHRLKLTRKDTYKSFYSALNRDGRFRHLSTPNLIRVCQTLGNFQALLPAHKSFPEILTGVLLSRRDDLAQSHLLVPAVSALGSMSKPSPQTVRRLEAILKDAVADEKLLTTSEIAELPVSLAILGSRDEELFLMLANRAIQMLNVANNNNASIKNTSNQPRSAPSAGVGQADVEWLNVWLRSLPGWQVGPPGLSKDAFCEFMRLLHDGGYLSRLTAHTQVKLVASLSSLVTHHKLEGPLRKASADPALLQQQTHQNLAPPQQTAMEGLRGTADYDPSSALVVNATMTWVASEDVLREVLRGTDSGGAAVRMRIIQTLHALLVGEKGDANGALASKLHTLHAMNLLRLSGALARLLAPNGPLKWQPVADALDDSLVGTAKVQSGSETARELHAFFLDLCSHLADQVSMSDVAGTSGRMGGGMLRLRDTETALDPIQMLPLGMSPADASVTLRFLAGIAPHVTLVGAEKNFVFGGDIKVGANGDSGVVKKQNGRLVEESDDFLMRESEIIDVNQDLKAEAAKAEALRLAKGANAYIRLFDELAVFFDAFLKAETAKMSANSGDVSSTGEKADVIAERVSSATTQIIKSVAKALSAAPSSSTLDPSTIHAVSLGKSVAVRLAPLLASLSQSGMLTPKASTDALDALVTTLGVLQAKQTFFSPQDIRGVSSAVDTITACITTSNNTTTTRPDTALAVLSALVLQEAFSSLPTPNPPTVTSAISALVNTADSLTPQQIDSFFLRVAKALPRTRGKKTNRRVPGRVNPDVSPTLEQVMDVLLDDQVLLRLHPQAQESVLDAAYALGYEV